MAYVILKNNNYQVSKIISGNDMQYHGNKWDNTNHYIKIEITEQEFLDIKNNVKIKSVSNTLVLFDSNEKHTGSTCTDKEYRIIININYYE